MVLITSSKKENFFITRIKKYKILTFTLFFILFTRFFGSLISYFTNKQVSFWIIALLPVIYFITWLIVVWIASKFTYDTLKEKFYCHPILTIVFFILFLIDLPSRLGGSDLGIGLIKTINVFEITLNYVFICFLLWILFCWISKKIWNNKKIKWIFYEKIIDKFFIFLPPIYKIILGLMVAEFIFVLLFALFSGLFNYSGGDLKKL